MLFVQRLLVLLTFFLLGVAYHLDAQTTWTGSISTAWNIPGNWSAGVPDANDDVTIPDVTNDPVISAAGAAAKSVIIQSGGLLTINTAGTLAINGSATGLLNQGTVQNHGTINIGNAAASGSYGLENHSTANNYASGKINIDGRWTQALMTQNGSFMNEGEINIGSLATNDSNTGIVVNGPFSNHAGGRIRINRAVYGIRTAMNFTNAGSVIMGDLATVPNLVHPQSAALINNVAGGELKGSGNMVATRFVNAGGSLVPGTPIGIMTFDGAEDFSNSTLAIEVNGLTPGSNHDQVVVNGTAMLGGTLHLTMNLKAIFGDTVTLLSATSFSGIFSTVTGLAANWKLAYTTRAVVLVYEGLDDGYNHWTGNVSADWNNAGNWTNGVPDAATDVMISDVTTDPVISTAGAVAKSLLIQSDGRLTINAAGSLAINGASTQALLNQGAVTNNGIIRIGNTAPADAGINGIVNGGIFTNHAGAQIHIGRILVSAGHLGIYNKSTGIFINVGNLLLGANSGAGTNGIRNEGTFNNNTSGQINVDRVNNSAMLNFGIFNNQAAINIGATAGGQSITTGITNFATFNNNAGGQINIDRVSTAIDIFGKSFTNAGTITAGATTNVARLVHGQNTGTFSNSTGALLKGMGEIAVAYFTNAGGRLSPGNPIGKVTLDGSEDLSNSTIAIDVNGTGNPGTAYDQVVVDGTATLGGTLDVSINYLPNNGDQFPIISADAISGTFSSVTGLPANWSVIYGATSVSLVYSGPSQLTTWTGAVNTDWSNAGNWSAGVPTTTQDVNIPNVANDPVISTNTAVARSVKVLAGGRLTIGAAGSLTLNGAVAAGLHNQGSVDNAGTITIGNIAASGTNGFDNGGYFTNDGQINIDRVTSMGIYHNGTGFLNRGTINIGSLNGGNTISWGIYANALFNNNAGAQIHINRVQSAIAVAANNFMNAGSITIGALTNVPTLLVGNGGAFGNNTGGVLQGTGSIDAPAYFNNGGVLKPGLPIGKLSFTGGENFSNSTLSMEVNGAGVAGTNFDQVVVNGTATLGGTLALSINYTPNAGDQISILSATTVTGTFNSVTGLPAGWSVVYENNAVKLSFAAGSVTTTWTGTVNTAWNNAGNWTAGIPDATTKVIIPAVTNDPVISTATAVARDITVQTGGVLTISNTGTLTIHGSSTQGILNQGTVQNSGIIGIGGTSAAGSYGIRNEATFYNNTGGQLNIDRTTTSAFYNVAGTFTNTGIVKIGANAATGSDGMDNDATFNNHTGGQIFIDRVSTVGIYNNGTVFDNRGSINIGSLSGGNTITWGIYNDKPFNNTGGQVQIDRVTSGIAANTGTFANTGLVTIGGLTNVTTLLASQGSGIFSNNTGGEFKGTGNVAASQFVDNGGKLSPGYSPGKLTFTGSEHFSSAIMNIEVSGVAIAGVDYDQVVVNGAATLGGNLAISAINGFKMAAGQSFTFLSASSITGQFASITWPAGVTGTVSYVNNTVVLSVASVLPLKLLAFTGRAADGKVALQWETAQEENTAVFEVERSTDGLNFMVIGTVAAAGSGANKYSMTDENPVAGNNYYRLKMKDLDGRFSLSQVIPVKVSGTGGLVVGPVPATNYVILRLKDPSMAGQHAQVFSATGNLLTDVVLTGTTRIDISGWPAGTYVIKTKAATYRLVKQ